VAKRREVNFTFSETATAHAFFDVQSRQTNQLGLPACFSDLLLLFHHRAFVFTHVVFHLDDYFLHFGVLGCLLLDHEEQSGLNDLVFLLFGRGL
jgi:hypothetical protein